VYSSIECFTSLHLRPTTETNYLLWLTNNLWSSTSPNIARKVFGLPGLRSDKLVLLLLKMWSHVQDRDG